MFYAVVLAGGVGSRFWPKSRRAHPKQLLDILGGRPLIQQTLDRLGGLFSREKILVVIQADQVKQIQQQIDLAEENILMEPQARNTAAAIGLAAIEIKRRAGSQAVFTVLPSDHYIENLDRFLKAVQIAKEVALKGYLVTVGIRPRYPEAGYGYIELGESLDDLGYPGVHQIKSFKEKPSMAQAAEFISEGCYLWNSGTFVWKVEVLLESLRRYLPDLYAGLQQIEREDLKSSAIARIYEGLSSISVDYGVMEKAANRAVVLGDYGWSDMGTWSALGELLPKDEQGNVQRGEVIQLDCSQSIFYGDQGLVAAIGLQGMIVVFSGDAVLICPKDRAEDVRKLVRQLEQRKKSEYL